MNDLGRRLFDVRYLDALRAELRAAAPQGPAAARLLTPAPIQLRRLGVFSGSFNPLTNAHTALAAAALQEVGLDLAAYTLSTLTTDKEQVTGAALDDRLAVLLAHTEGRESEGVLLLNRGLYVEQARLLRAAFPALERLWFLVGFDKIVQVFDPRCYADREAALSELFALAEFAVAPRAGAGQEELDRLLDRPENRRYRAAVRYLPAPPELAHLSSSLLRDQLAAGATSDGRLPTAAAALIAATGAYRAAPGGGADPYALRRALLDEAWAADETPEPDALARRWQAAVAAASPQREHEGAPP
jgi:nicotinic acid mononucleotide adenylyltransferase